MLRVILQLSCHLRRTFAGFVILGLILSGCGGPKLIPKDLKDYLATAMKTERRNVDVTQPFRTTFIYRVPGQTIVKARESTKAFIEKVEQFSKEQGVSDFLNDSLRFVVRLDTDPDVFIRFDCGATDLRNWMDGSVSEAEFMDRCIKEEHWAEELG